jgi:hypothetical protein
LIMFRRPHIIEFAAAAYTSNIYVNFNRKTVWTNAAHESRGRI